jgi:hypothetical protein
MHKKILPSVLFFIGSALVSAYNPPAGGQNLFRITNPFLLAGSGSVAGGALFGVTPSSVVNNPALPAYEQRVTVDAGATLLFDSSDSDHSVGSAFETGLLVPSKWGVAGALLQGVFVPFDDMQLGNSVTMTGSFSKDITDQLAVGAGVDLGVFYGYQSDWLGVINAGCLYRAGTISRIRDVRFGFVLLNIGKTFTQTTVSGLDGDDADYWPGVITPRAGAAGTILSAGRMDVGASVDISAPSFQDFVLDTGLQMVYGGFVKVSSSWEFDAREFSQDSKNLLPSLGVSFKFTFNSKDHSLLAERGWQQSEMTTAVAWRQLYENVNAVSAGAVMNLGMKDTQAPEITLWGDK